MYGFDGTRKATTSEESRLETEVEVRVRKLKNGKAAATDEVTGEIIKGGDDKVVDWILMLCNMTFESGVLPEN